MCRKADKSGKTNFCAPCEASVIQNGPAIIEIAEENETFKSGGFFSRFSPVLSFGSAQDWMGSRSTVQAIVETHHGVS